MALVILRVVTPVFRVVLHLSRALNHHLCERGLVVVVRLDDRVGQLRVQKHCDCILRGPLSLQKFKKKRDLEGFLWGQRQRDDSPQSASTQGLGFEDTATTSVENSSRNLTWRSATTDVAVWGGGVGEPAKDGVGVAAGDVAVFSCARTLPLSSGGMAIPTSLFGFEAHLPPVHIQD
jgi:hypothetical protein